MLVIVCMTCPPCAHKTILDPGQGGGQGRNMHLFLILQNEDILLVWNFLTPFSFFRVSRTFPSSWMEFFSGSEMPLKLSSSFQLPWQFDNPVLWRFPWDGEALSVLLYESPSKLGCLPRHLQTSLSFTSITGCPA